MDCMELLGWWIVLFENKNLIYAYQLSSLLSSVEVKHFLNCHRLEWSIVDLHDSHFFARHNFSCWNINHTAPELNHYYSLKLKRTIATLSGFFKSLHAHLSLLVSAGAEFYLNVVMYILYNREEEAHLFPMPQWSRAWKCHERHKMKIKLRVAQNTYL